MIALGSDHGGFALKQEVIKHLEARGLEYKDYGTYSDASCDYPVYGKAVAHAVADGECEKGIIICGTGIGFTPIIGVDFKTGKWNFSAKYEFKTRIRLKNKAVNQAPSISALPDNLSRQMVETLTQVFTNKGMTPENAQAVAANTTQAVLTNDDVVKTMASLKTEFDAKLEEAIGEYEDGKKIAGDMPAYLALGVGYSPVNTVRVNVGFHWFDDKHATSYNNREPGGLSAHSYPGRVFPGKRMAGQYGNKKVTVKHLQVIKVDSDRNLIFVRGAVPGPKNGVIVVRKG